MAGIAPNCLPFGDGPHTALDTEAPIRQCFGQDGSTKIRTVASLTARRIFFVESGVPIFREPAWIVDIVQPMRSIRGQGKTAGAVAGCTLCNRPDVSLNFGGSQIVIGMGSITRPDGMRASVTTLTSNASMSLALSLIHI